MPGNEIDISTYDNHSQNRSLQQDARAWARFTGINYSAALRLMQHPLAQGILGERISARKLISTLSDHPVIGTDAITGEVLGEFGVNTETPLELQREDGFLELILCAEMLRIFTRVENPEPPTIDAQDSYDEPWIGSYSLKHYAEWFFKPTVSYVSNGRLIWAAAALGIPMVGVPDSPNVLISLPSLESSYLRSALVPNGQRPIAHHNQPPGYAHLRAALDLYLSDNKTPERWIGTLPKAHESSPFHDWLIAQVDPSGERGEFGSRQCLAYDYRAGVADNDHRIAQSGDELLLILNEVLCSLEAYQAAERLVAEWSRSDSPVR